MPFLRGEAVEAVEFRTSEGEAAEFRTSEGAAAEFRTSEGEAAESGICCILPSGLGSATLFTTAITFFNSRQKAKKAYSKIKRACILACPLFTYIYIKFVFLVLKMGGIAGKRVMGSWKKEITNF